MWFDGLVWSSYLIQEHCSKDVSSDAKGIFLIPEWPNPYQEDFYLEDVEE